MEVDILGLCNTVSSILYIEEVVDVKRLVTACFQDTGSGCNQEQALRKCIQDRL